MCRFLAYKGSEISLADVLTRSEQSMIRQSFHAREREEPLNGDGFGVGWYVPEIDPTPCIFTSVQPAWANRNLRRLADKIRSACLFAHVRAATPGTAVAEINCHPFQYGRLMWMHNGRISGFRRIRRALCEHLSDEFFNFIQGTTDSEHAFALFLNELGVAPEKCELDDLHRALQRTIRLIEQWLADAEITEASWLNFCLTDGNHLLATRYVTRPASQPQSLYFAQGRRFELHNGHYRMTKSEGEPARAVIIASEPLTYDHSDWEPVPVNHSISVSPDCRIDLQSI